MLSQFLKKVFSYLPIVCLLWIIEFAFVFFKYNRLYDENVAAGLSIASFMVLFFAVFELLIERYSQRTAIALFVVFMIKLLTVCGLFMFACQNSMESDVIFLSLLFAYLFLMGYHTTQLVKLLK